MSLTAAEVAEIMRLVEQSTFDELTLEMDGVKLSLRRGAAVQANGAALGNEGKLEGSPSAARASAAAGTSSGIASSATAANHGVSTSGAAKPTPPDANSHDVASPLLGTFYRAPKPGAPPFVEVGAKVAADTVIGIIEVMKLMNTVRAGVGGTVTEIFVADGALVEFEQPLIRVGKTG